MDRISERVIRSMIDVDGYITANSLAELTDISASNIKHNLTQIKEELYKFGVTLQSIPKKGICLLATPEQKQEILQALHAEVSQNSEFYTYRKEYILETLYLFKANYTIQLFAEELSVSKNTIQKDLEQIDRELLKFHVKIKRIRNQGLVLEGREFNIRQSMIDTNNSKYWNWSSGIIVDDTGGMDLRISKKAYTYLSNTYSLKDLVRIQSELWACERKLGVQFIDISFCRLLEYIQIMQERVRMGKYIRRDVEQDDGVSIDGKYLRAAADMIENLLPASKKGYPLEAKYLAARLFVAAVCDDADVEVGNAYREVVIDFLADIEEMVGTKVLSADENLIGELNLAFVRIKVRETFEILDWSDLYQDIQNQRTGLYGICLANLYKPEERVGCRFRQDDAAWIVLLIDNCLKDDRSRIPAVLVHGTNRHVALYQKGKIEEALPEIAIRRIVYFKDYDEEREKDSLVIATVPFEGRAENLIEVTKHIGKKDLAHIQDDMDHLEWQYQEKLLDEILKEVFTENIIIPQLHVRTKEEAVQKMAEALMREGYVERGYCDKVLEREKFCPTSIGNEIALPHHYKEYINSNKIAVARLKYPVVWNQEEKVRLVFLIAIRYRESRKIKLLFHYLYGLIENKELLKNIQTAETGRQILDYLTSLKL